MSLILVGYGNVVAENMRKLEQKLLYLYTSFWFVKHKHNSKNLMKEYTVDEYCKMAENPTLMKMGEICS